MRSGLTVSALSLVLAISCGCNALLTPVSGVPASRLPPELLAEPKNNLEPIDVSRLGQDRPDEYLLDTGDVMAVYIEDVLGAPGALPPILSTGDPLLPPSVGTPIPVRGDGTIILPLVDPIPLRGLSIEQAQEAVEKAYLDARILLEEDLRVLVTLFRPRQTRVLVLRGDQAAGEASRTTFVDLPAYENDLLNALIRTGGLPGENAKNTVRILRSTVESARERDIFIKAYFAQYKKDPCDCAPPPPEASTTTVIPLRLPPGEVPCFDPEDVILETGDVVILESRDAEVYYTAGLLGTRQQQLPRDFDLDVIQAIALSGASLLGQQGGGFISGDLAQVPPTQLFIIRRLPCGQQFTISVDLSRALQDPQERILVQAEDILVLRYKPSEEVLRFSLATFFASQIQDLFRPGR